MSVPKRKYTLSLMDSKTLERIWDIHLTRSGVFVLCTLSIIILLVVFSLLILFTPLRRLMPGTESIREELVTQSVRVDSLLTEVQLQEQYIAGFKQILAGEVLADTLPSADSLQMIMRQQLLDAQNEATADFIAQYEAREKDELALFDVQQSTQVTLFPAVQGKMVTAVLNGTVISVWEDWNHTYSMILQHATYVSIYHGLAKVSKNVGTDVVAGEVIAVVGEQLPDFELWQDGRCIKNE